MYLYIQNGLVIEESETRLENLAPDVFEVDTSSQEYIEDKEKQEVLYSKQRIEDYIYSIYPERKQNQDHIKFTFATTQNDTVTQAKLLNRAFWIKNTKNALRNGNTPPDWVG